MVISFQARAPPSPVSKCGILPVAEHGLTSFTAPTDEERATGETQQSKTIFAKKKILPSPLWKNLVSRSKQE